MTTLAYGTCATCTAYRVEHADIDEAFAYISAQRTMTISDVRELWWAHFHKRGHTEPVTNRVFAPPQLIRATR